MKSKLYKIVLNNENGTEQRKCSSELLLNLVKDFIKGDGGVLCIVSCNENKEKGQ